MAELVKRCRETVDCEVSPPSGLPRIRPNHVLPDDVRDFYGLAGGVSLFASAEFPIRIVSPSDVVSANLVIVGEEFPNDITDSWYIIARGSSSESITIDFDAARAGRCYDSFWDRHGVAGSNPIIALSFYELLKRLLANEGHHWFWLEPEFQGYGDAYDRAGSE